MKKLLHVAKYYPPHRGGIETATKFMCDGASEELFDVKVVCFSKDKSNEFRSKKNLTIISCFSRLNIFSQPISLLYIYQVIKKSYKSDIVHFHYPNLYSLFLHMFIKKQKKIITSWHSDIVKQKKFKIFYSFLEKMLLKRSDIIIVATSNYAENSYSLKDFQDKIKIIPYGVSSKFKYKNKKLTSDRLTVLSVGRLVSYKGFGVLIDAALHINRDIKIVIVGNGPLYEELTYCINKRKLSKKVYIKNEVNDEELKSLYKSADIFCLPSITKAEAFGIVLIEAMTYGLPIVTTEIVGSGVPSVNDDKVTGINVPPGDYKELAKAINFIASNVSVYSKYSTASRKRYESLFTDEIFIKNYIKVLNELC